MDRWMDEWIDRLDGWMDGLILSEPMAVDMSDLTEASLLTVSW
jgi:hypothetical protein